MSKAPIFNPFDEDERSGRRPVVWAILGMGALCICSFLTIMVYIYKPDSQKLIDQYFPSPTPTATNTHTPTLTMKVTSTITSTPSPTSTSGPTKTPNSTATQRVLKITETAQAYNATAVNVKEKWTVSFSETFSKNPGAWSLGEQGTNNGMITYQILDGKYIWEVNAHQPVIAQVETDGRTYRDFYVSIDIQQIKGSDTANYGIVFRKDKNGNFYYFGVKDFIYILYLYIKGSQQILILPTGTQNTQVGGINNIAVLAERSRFTFFINNKYVTTITDDRIAYGEIALAVEFSQKGDRGVFEFDNLMILVPK